MSTGYQPHSQLWVTSDTFIASFQHNAVCATCSQICLALWILNLAGKSRSCHVLRDSRVVWNCFGHRRIAAVLLLTFLFYSRLHTPPPLPSLSRSLALSLSLSLPLSLSLSLALPPSLSPSPSLSLSLPTPTPPPPPLSLSGLPVSLLLHETRPCCFYLLRKGKMFVRGMFSKQQGTFSVR